MKIYKLYNHTDMLTDDINLPETKITLTAYTDLSISQQTC